MKSISLIHPFQVAKDQVQEFMHAWKRVDAYMKKQKGFIKTQLHQSVETDPGFRFINIAYWASPKDFQRAIASETFKNLAKPVLQFSCKPSLYEVVHN